MSCGKTLKDFIERHKISLEDIEQSTDIDKQHINNVICDKEDLSILEAVKLQKCMGISAYNLLTSQLSRDIKRCKDGLEYVDIPYLFPTKHIKGEIDTRSYNALRRWETRNNRNLTLDDVSNPEFLKNISCMGKTTISYVLECPKKYLRRD